MKKKLFFYLFLLVLFLINCNQTIERDFVFNPTKPTKYQFDFTSDQLNLSSKLTCNYENKNDVVKVSTLIDELQYKGNSEMDKQINAEYQNYVNTTIISKYNKYGNSLDKENSDKRAINPELFVVEYPKHKIKEGDTWTGQKSPNPDFIFKAIKTKYKLIEIKDNNNIINVEMTFEKEAESNAIMNSMTKSYNGHYVVDNNGVVKSAELDMKAFSGISNLKGKIQIKEIK